MEQGLSILIPTYNYSIVALVEKLSSEAKTVSEAIEIIVVDDASPHPVPENATVAQCANVSYHELTKNIGRTAARQLLAEKANYSNLLFLDADVIPVNSNFITKYLTYLGKKGVIFGGIAYTNERPQQDEILRWIYGRERETLSVAQRNKAVYSSINSGCFFIDKASFFVINKTLQLKAYGMDLLFKEKLKEHTIPILHIDNPVYHLGLENNEQFLKKSFEAIDTTVLLEKKGVLPDNARKIQKTYVTLKKWGLLGLFQLCFSMVSSKVKRNLLSEKPSMRGFDLYRLQYYIQLKRKKSA